MPEQPQQQVSRAAGTIAAILAPGIHQNIPPETYHAQPGLSQTMLHYLAESPATLKDVLDNPDCKPTADQVVGIAVHALVLEPQTFGARFVVGPEISGVTKEYKAFKAAAENTGKSVLKTAEARWCEAIARRVNANPMVRTWLTAPGSRGRWTEPTIIWERDGFLCRGRPDLVLPDERVVVDLKTTRYSMEAFSAEIAKRRYHWQAVWYLDGLESATGSPWNRFVFVAAHKTRPFLVSLHEIVRGDATFELARQETDRLFELYKECTTTRHWPGYPDEVRPVCLPEWAMSQLGDELGYEDFDNL